VGVAHELLVDDKASLYLRNRCVAVMEAQVSSKSAREAMIAKISLIIPNIPQDIIGSVLDSNKGDVNRTVMALLAVAKASMCIACIKRQPSVI